MCRSKNRQSNHLKIMVNQMEIINLDGVSKKICFVKGNSHLLFSHADIFRITALNMNLCICAPNASYALDISPKIYVFRMYKLFYLIIL